MTLCVFHDASMQHLDQVGRETDAAVREGLIAERDAVWIRSALQVARADVKHAVERGRQPRGSDDVGPREACGSGPLTRVSPPPSSLGREDTLVLPRGDDSCRPAAAACAEADAGDPSLSMLEVARRAGIEPPRGPEPGDGLGRAADEVLVALYWPAMGPRGDES